MRAVRWRLPAVGLFTLGSRRRTQFVSETRRDLPMRDPREAILRMPGDRGSRETEMKEAYLWEGQATSQFGAQGGAQT